jgi:ferredoxin
MARKLNVSVDKQECVASQTCVAALPNVFAVDDDGLAEVVDQNAAAEAELIVAGRNCPSGAIWVLDAETGEDLL